MTPGTKTASPAPTGLAVKKSNRHQSADHPRMTPATTAVDTVLDPAEYVPPEPADAVAGTWAVVVNIGPGPNGLPRTRRRVYLSASAAQRAVEDARERGQQASAVLVELRPVGGAL